MTNKRDTRITKRCPWCHKLSTVEAYSCSHEDTCSVDYTVQCLNKDCMHKASKLGCFSPGIDKHMATEKQAIAEWNRGNFNCERPISRCGSNYMGD